MSIKVISMLNNKKFLITFLSLCSLGFIQCMQTSNQPGAFMQLSQDTKAQVMLDMVVEAKDEDQLFASLNDIKSLSFTCKELYRLFMHNSDFGRKLHSDLVKYLLILNNIEEAQPSRNETFDKVKAAEALIAVEIGTPVARSIFDNLFVTDADQTDSDPNMRNSFFLNSLNAAYYEWACHYDPVESLLSPTYNKHVRLSKYRISKLVQWGADINSKVGYQNLPILICALRSKNKELVLFVLSKGADANVVDGEGNSAMSLAIRSWA